MPKLMISHADVLTEAERMFAALEANAADLSHLDSSRGKLASQLELAREAYRQQSAFNAGKQLATKQLQQTLNDLSKLVTFLRHGVKEHYGSGSEKLVDFGLVPFRSRARRVATPPAPPVPVPPAVE